MPIIKSVDENYKDIYKSITPEMEEAINLSKATFSSQRDTVNKNYGSLISDTNTEYYDEENRNAIQKIVNEQKIARKMENLGLTDSGLNRTQQTAVQLSYSNNQAKLERQRQKAVDALNLEMQGKLSEININESNTVASIKDKYSQAALSAAQEKYNTEVNALADVTKEQLKASSGSSNNANLFKHSRYDTESGNMIFYDSDGKEKSFTAGKNPYTSHQNARLSVNEEGKVTVDSTWAASVLKNKNASDINKAAADYGVFSNGYQPKGIYEDGKPLGTVRSYTTFEAEDGRKDVNLWYTTSSVGSGRRTIKRYWVWDGEHNTYKEVSYDSTTGAINEI